jgi:ADP-heptose:LPS heptosyltransferase
MNSFLFIKVIPDMIFSQNNPDAPANLPLLQNPAIKTLAIFRALQLGDMLCAVPALRALRKARADIHIALVGLPWAEQFASRFNRYLDDFIAFPGHPALPEQPVHEAGLAAFYKAMRDRHFDLALQMHGNGRASNRIVAACGAHAVAGYARKSGYDEDETDPKRFFVYPESGAEPTRLLKLTEFLGAPSHGMHLEFPLTDRDEQELSQSGLNAGLIPGSYICIHPGARIRDKCWPPQCFAEVADRLSQEFHLTIVLTGSGQEKDLTNAVAHHMKTPAIDAAAPISIGAMAALMSRSRLLICNDTGVSHIAAGLKLPSIVIFSKTDMQRWSPLNRERHRCVKDPEGKRAATVLQQARALLAHTGIR